VQVVLVVSLFLVVTLGLLAFAVIRLRTEGTGRATTAVALAMGSSLTLLAVLVTLCKVTALQLSGLAGYAPYGLAAVVYVGLLIWFVLRRRPASVASVVTAGATAMIPGFYLALLVALVVSCSFGDCI
jgi:hypothetical protein